MIKLPPYIPIISRYRVPSKSGNGKYYEVLVYKDGSMKCECMAGSMGQKCSHKKIVEAERKGETTYLK